MHRSAAAIIKNEKGEILMLDRKNFPFGWACPAGHIEKNETPEEALKREVGEEVGIDVVDFRLLHHEFIEWNECRRGVRGHDFLIYEIIKWEGKVEGNVESKGIRWVGKDEIENIKLEEVWEYFFKKLKLLE